MNEQELPQLESSFRVSIHVGASLTLRTFSEATWVLEVRAVLQSRCALEAAARAVLLSHYELGVAVPTCT